MMLLPTFTQRGDIAPLLNKIHHCDALALLRRLPDASVDLVLTDPPYGLNKKVFAVDRSMRGKYEAKGTYTAIREAWDNFAPLDWMNEVSRVIKPTGSVLCFGGRESIYSFANRGLELAWRIVNDITFVKLDAVPNFTGRMMTESTERAIWFSPSGSHWTYNRLLAKQMNNGVNFRDVWEMVTPKLNRLHPAQKPLEIIETLIAILSNPTDVVVDCFAGSATTAIACMNLDRRFICGDSHLPYVEMSRQRVQNHSPFMASVFKDGSVQLSLFAS
jgi:DNA modification methylase